MQKIQRELRQQIWECGEHRPMLIEIVDGVATVRPKGIRRKHAVPINAPSIWQRGVKQTVEGNRKKRRR